MAGLTVEQVYHLLDELYLAFVKFFDPEDTREPDKALFLKFYRRDYPQCDEVSVLLDIWEKGD